MTTSKRQLGLFDLTCVGLNAIIGSSIFLFPAKLAGVLGPASVLAFATAGLLLTSVALCVAEASSYFDEAGGAYLYGREAFGPQAGFAIGWLAWVTQVTGWAAVANGVAVYVASGASAAFAIKATAVSVVLIMGWLNYRGVRLGAAVSNFFTVAKILPLLVLVAAGLMYFEPANFTPFAPHGLSPLGPACFMAFFAFQGFESVPVPSGEVDNPKRNVPLAVMIAMGISTILYMFVQGSAVGLDAGLAASARPLADAAGKGLGAWGATLLTIGAVISMTGYCAGNALVTPRYLVGLAEHKDFPKWLGAPHPVYGTPFRAVAATTGVTLVLAFFLDFAKLVDFSNLVICFQYLATCAAIPVLRKKRAGQGRVRLPGGLALPIFGAAATIWLGSQAAVSEIGWTVVALLLGFVLKAFSPRFA